MAREKGGAETLDYEEVDVLEALRERTSGRGPDACIDAVGMEAHMPDAGGAYDRVKQAMMLETDRPGALREAMLACPTAARCPCPGVYGGLLDKIPLGAVKNRSLTLKTGRSPCVTPARCRMSQTSSSALALAHPPVYKQ